METWANRPQASVKIIWFPFWNICRHTVACRSSGRADIKLPPWDQQDVRPAVLQYKDSAEKNKTKSNTFLCTTTESINHTRVWKSTAVEQKNQWAVGNPFAISSDQISFSPYLWHFQSGQSRKEQIQVWQVNNVGKIMKNGLPGERLLPSSPWSVSHAITRNHKGGGSRVEVKLRRIGERLLSQHRGRRCGDNNHLLRWVSSLQLDYQTS